MSVNRSPSTSPSYFGRVKICSNLLTLLLRDNLIRVNMKTSSSWNRSASFLRVENSIYEHIFSKSHRKLLVDTIFSWYQFGFTHIKNKNWLVCSSISFTNVMVIYLIFTFLPCPDYHKHATLRSFLLWNQTVLIYSITQRQWQLLLGTGSLDSHDKKSSLFFSKTYYIFCPYIWTVKEMVFKCF